MPLSRGSVGLICAVHSTPASPSRKLDRIDSGALGRWPRRDRARRWPAAACEARGSLLLLLLHWAGGLRSLPTGQAVGPPAFPSAPGLPLPETGSSISPWSPSALVSNSGCGGSIGLVAPSSVDSSLSSMKSSLPNIGRRQHARRRSASTSSWMPGRRREARRERRLRRLVRSHGPVSRQPLIVLLSVNGVISPSASTSASRTSMPVSVPPSVTIWPLMTRSIEPGGGVTSLPSPNERLAADHEAGRQVRRCRCSGRRAC